MCLALLEFTRGALHSCSGASSASSSLFLAANRDEYYARASLPPALEQSGPVHFLAPRDGRAGGTWIGVNDRAIFALITNRTDLPPPAAGAAGASRGLLVRAALESASLDLALARLEEECRQVFAPYNLLAGDGERLFVIEQSNPASRAVRELTPGVHAVSNLGAAGDRDIPEVARALREWELGARAGVPRRERAIGILRSHAGAQGLPPICRHEGDRGTVSSTLILIEGGVIAMEHAPGPPCTHPYAPVPALELARR